MDRVLSTIYGVFSFGLGACIASFLNVVIWRVPRGESIVSPPSHCPKCGSPIRWYQNIPILSWLALRGKCANCKAPISPRYILVETLGGVLFLAAYLYNGLGEPLCRSVPWLFVSWIWISLMIVGSMIDFDHQLLPDFVTVGGMVLGVVWAGYDTVISLLATDSSFPMSQRLFSLWWSLGGLAVGFGLLWLIRFLGSKAFGREAMGEGDVFLMGAVGALFGPVAVLVTLIVSAVLGSVVGVALQAAAKVKLGGFTPIPYGPYIALGCLYWMFFGPETVAWYLALMQ